MSKKPLTALVLLVVISLAAVAFLSLPFRPNTVSSEREKNTKILQQMLSSKSHINDVEKIFGRGEILTNAVEEIRVRLSLFERKNNIRKASQYPNAIKYNPLYGNPWDIMIFVFYDKNGEMRDFCFGGQ